MAEEWSEQVSGGNFASLMDYHLVRKGAAEPSPVMAPEESQIAQRVVPASVDALNPTKPPRRSKRRELPAACTDSDVPADPRRMSVRLSANEYKALGLVAVKKGTTPQDLLRKLLRNFLVEFVEQCNGSRY